ncbi:MAG: RND transporter, partial [Planctomycetes bacterium]|nr:RND transporter [Planctomycetota bacterium]
MSIVSRFYRNYSVHLLLAAILFFPYIYYKAETLPSNNNIETWLPRESTVRSTYERFREYFGAEEIILVGLEGISEDDPLVEALCERLERLPGIRSCWSPTRLKAVMHDFGVPDDEIEERLKGLAVSEKEQLIGLVAVLSSEGLKDRVATVARVRDQLEYCQLRGDSVRLAGAPVVVAELDRLGNRESNRQYFLVTL